MSECSDYYIKIQLKTDQGTKSGEETDKVLCEAYLPFSCNCVEQAKVMYDGIATHYPLEMIAEYDKLFQSYYLKIGLYTSGDHMVKFEYAPVQVVGKKEAIMVFEAFLDHLPLRTGQEKHWSQEPICAGWTDEKSKAELIEKIR